MKPLRHFLLGEAGIVGPCFPKITALKRLMLDSRGYESREHLRVQ